MKLAMDSGKSNRGRENRLKSESSIDVRSPGIVYTDVRKLFSVSMLISRGPKT